MEQTGQVTTHELALTPAQQASECVLQVSQARAQNQHCAEESDATCLAKSRSRSQSNDLLGFSN